MICKCIRWMMLRRRGMLMWKLNLSQRAWWENYGASFSSVPGTVEADYWFGRWCILKIIIVCLSYYCYCQSDTNLFWRFEIFDDQIRFSYIWYCGHVMCNRTLMITNQSIWSPMCKCVRSVCFEKWIYFFSTVIKKRWKFIGPVFGWCLEEFFFSFGREDV